MTFWIQFRVGYGYPLFHSNVLLFRFLIATLYVALMINIVCYCILKCAYIFFFDTINKILDQTLLNLVKVFSVGISFFLVAADTYWKVRSSWLGQQILGNADVAKNVVKNKMGSRYHLCTKQDLRFFIVNIYSEESNA